MSDERERRDDGDGGGFWIMLVVGALVLGGGGFWFMVSSARMSRQRAAVEMARVEAVMARREAEAARRQAEVQLAALKTVSPAPNAAEAVAARTINLDAVEMKDYQYKDENVGKVGQYVAGDTPASTKFVTGRFVLDPGKTPHAPHVHPEEEVMIVESGNGEIFCDGKTTKVGPGSVMYTTPNAPHGITNTGNTPLVFYFIKWEAKGEKK